MKNIFLLFAILICNITLKSQVFITLELDTKRSGIALHLNPDKQIGVYANLSYGVIKNTKFKSEHQKISLGLSLKLNNKSKVLFGYCNHKFNDIKDDNIFINTNNVYNHSVDLGFIGKLTNRFYFLTLTDPINWQTDFGIGFKF